MTPGPAVSTPAMDTASAQTADAADTLDCFLADVERRAYQMALMSTGDRDEALDLVQDAMMRLVRHYRNRPAAEWRPLFYRILHNGIMDWHRRRKVRDRWIFSGSKSAAADTVEMVDKLDGQAPGVVRQVQGEQALQAVRQAIASLPPRQRQALLLRAWEGLSVADTARVMACSQGSVKTHYFRAVRRLRPVAEEFL